MDNHAKRRGLWRIGEPSPSSEGRGTKTPVTEREILDEAGIARTLRRVAHEIVEAHPTGEIALVGIRTGGLYLAERLRKLVVAVDSWPAGRAVDRCATW